MGNYFLRMYGSIKRHPIKSTIIFAILLAILAFLVRQIRFEEDITKLIPIKSENKDLQQVLKTVNFADKIMVNIQRDSAGNTQDLTQYAQQFIDSLESHFREDIKSIQGKVERSQIMGTMDFVHKNLPLFLDTGDYSDIAKKLTPDSISRITQENYNTLISPSGLVAKKNILRDPLGITFLGLKKLQQLGFGDDFVLKNGFLVTKDGNHLLLFLNPVHPSNETAQNESLVHKLYALQQLLNTQYAQKVHAEYYGATLVAVANAQQIKHDIQFTVGIAITLLLLILVFFYRKLTLPLILFAPTAFGALLAMATLYLLRDGISAISLGIGSVLLGVTLDYALHILTHIRNHGSTQDLYAKVAPSILMSSLTTASAFLCLLFLQSQALQDLGIFAAISVVGASFFALLFIPLVYKMTGDNTPKHTFFDRWAHYPLHKAKWALTVVPLLLAISLFTYDRVGFDNDLSKLNYEPIHLTKARERLDALTNLNSKSIYLVAYGTPLEKVLQQNDTLFQQLQQLKAEGKIKSLSSAGALVQSQKKQQEKLAQWEAFWNDSTRKELQENLSISSQNIGFTSEAYQGFHQWLATNFEPVGLKEYQELASFSLTDFLAERDGMTTMASLIKVDTSQTQKIKSQFEANPHILTIDRQGMNESFLGSLKSDFNRLIRYSALVVLLLLILFYSSTELTVVTALPIFLTWLLAIGLMGLLEIQFNIFNIIISTFIFGLGVDYSIFVTNGLLTELRTGEKALPTHKTSIILSVVTTILGVGVLIFAKHPALYTISVVSLIGILSAAFISFTLQPLLFKLFIGSHGKRPISIRYFLHSVFSFGYFGLGGLLFSAYAKLMMWLFPKSRHQKNTRFHILVSKLKKSVLYTNGFVTKKIIGLEENTFTQPTVLIANHSSFLDILCIGMLSPKIVFMVNDWVYRSPIFGPAAKLAGAYPATMGAEKGEDFLRKKVQQGFSVIVYPEGTRSTSNKVRRFHKGAFLLAEKLGLDITPILIHGTSEVLPKGTFTIRDGSITVKILDRIPLQDSRYGETARERTKSISQFFKKRFTEVRNDVEGPGYFNRTILEDFRFKGSALYKKVKKRLKDQQNTHHQLLRHIPQKAQIVNLAEKYGELGFLLALDSTDRKIFSYIPHAHTWEIVTHSFLTHKYGIRIFDRIEKMSGLPADVLILDQDTMDKVQSMPEILREIHILLLLSPQKEPKVPKVFGPGFHTHFKNDTFMVLKRIAGNE
ncbi:MAG: MMPL family transporter [Flavobacteriaceae bacterium]